MADQYDEMKRALLANYEQKRGDLDVLIAALRRDLSMEADEQSARRTEPLPPLARTSTFDVNELVRPGDFFGKTQVQAMEEFLQRTNKTPASLQELAQAMFRGKATDSFIQGATKLRNLSSLLSKTDIFFSVARGRWGLSEWYPNKQKARRATKENKPNSDTKDSEAMAS